MGHNPHVYEWRSRRPSIGFADQLTVNRRLVGNVVLADEEGVFSYVGVVGMHVTRGFDTVEDRTGGRRSALRRPSMGSARVWSGRVVIVARWSYGRSASYTCRLLARSVRQPHGQRGRWRVLIQARGPLNVVRFDAAISNRFPGELVIDLSGATFIDMYGLAGLTTLLEEAAKRGLRRRMYGPKQASVARYLARIGFSDRLAASSTPCPLPNVDARRSSDVLLPLQIFDEDDTYLALSKLLYARLAGRSMPMVEVTCTALCELANNTIEHSGAPGMIAAQVYDAGTNRERIDLVVADAGVGIRDSLAARHNPATDRDAIELALKYLISSVDDEGRGQGLATTAEDVVNLKGAVRVRSGADLCAISQRGRNHVEVARLPGTIVHVTMPL